MTSQEYNIRRKRVAIAKDALLRLRGGQVTVTRGNYAVPKTGGGPWVPDREKTPKGIQSSCEVCALGALFISNAVKQFGFLGVIDYPVSDEDGVQWTVMANVRPMLEPVFGALQLRLIEIAFEGSMSATSVFRNFIASDLQEYAELPLGQGEDWEERALAFGNKFARYDSVGRLEAILQNIIDNKGIFIP